MKCNVAGCGYDGGDCCPSDCADYGLNVVASPCVNVDCYSCEDPSSADNLAGGACDLDVPGVPTNVECEGTYDFESLIDLNWDAVDGADTYTSRCHTAALLG